MLCSSCIKQKLNGRPQTAAGILILYYTLKLPSSASGTRRRFLDEADFVVGQAVELVDEPVDLPIRRVNLPLNRRALLRSRFTYTNEQGNDRD